MKKERSFYLKALQAVSVSLLMLLLSMPLPAQGTGIIFQGQPLSIEINDPVLLSWDVPAGIGTGDVYITNIGRVERKGQLQVTPKFQLTTYTLISEDATGLKVAQVTIHVKGGRDAQDAFPQREDFKNKRSCNIAAPKLDHLLDCFHRVLQDSMGFEVDERYNRKNEITVLVTKPFPRDKNDRGIRSRLVAYWIEVLPHRSTDGKYTCEIRTFIQFQRIKEKTWCLEKSNELHRLCAEKLCREAGKAI
jgi:hypothetical protein